MDCQQLFFQFLEKLCRIFIARGFFPQKQHHLRQRCPAAQDSFILQLLQDSPHLSWSLAEVPTNPSDLAEVLSSPISFAQRRRSSPLMEAAIWKQRAVTLIPHMRIGTVKDVTQTRAFIRSSGSSAVTGSVSRIGAIMSTCSYPLRSSTVRTALAYCPSASAPLVKWDQELQILLLFFRCLFQQGQNLT